MDQQMVDKLEREIEQAIAGVVNRLRLWQAPIWMLRIQNSASCADDKVHGKDKAKGASAWPLSFLGGGRAAEKPATSQVLGCAVYWCIVKGGPPEGSKLRLRPTNR